MEVNDFTKQLEQVDWHEEAGWKQPAVLIPAMETISNSFSFRPKDLILRMRHLHGVYVSLR